MSAPHRSVLRRWRCGVEVQPWGETKEKRSPKERSAVSGTVNLVSQVALDHLGQSHHQMGQKRRLGSGQQDRGGHGDNLAILGGACLPMPSLRLSPTSMNLSQLLQTLRFLEGRLRK